MGKGSRNRQKHRAEPKQPEQPMPEMMPNTADEDDASNSPSHLSADTRDQVEPLLRAWGLLQSYTLELLMETETKRPEPGPDADEQEREVHRLITKLKPHMIASAPHTAAEFVSMMKPRWRGKIARAIFRETVTWLHESGYNPDHRALFAGATTFAQFMAPAHHREEVTRLLDYDRLADRAAVENQNFPSSDRIPLFAFEGADNTIWFDWAMTEAHPVVMVHAAAALATWVQSQPGAVLDVMEKRLEISQRSMKYEETVMANTPRRDPHEPEAGEEPWVAPWKINNAVPTWDNTPMGRPVPVRYDGAPLTPWAAAHLWAKAICEFGILEPKDVERFGERECVVLTRAITAIAEAQGIDVHVSEVESPEYFSTVSLVGLHERALHEVHSVLMFANQEGTSPQQNDPGFDTDHELWKLAAAPGITARDVLDNPELEQQINAGAEEWEGIRKEAQTLVFHVIVKHATDRKAPAALGLFGHRLNAYLERQKAEQN